MYPWAFDDCNPSAIIELCGCKFELSILLNECLAVVMEMLKNKSYSNVMANTYTKHYIVYQVYRQTGQPEAEQYLNEHAPEVFRMLVDEDERKKGE